VCGIAGILTGEGRPCVEPGALRRMAAVLRHRGPDGFGYYLDDRVGLAHTRLSIIDLSGGAQPLCNETGTIWVTFNGEIFNYVELRGDLEARGHRFSTRSDTEVIVHAFEEWGAEAWRRFNGQFAFGLWDSAARRLWLVRDRAGMLPLFYAEPGGRVAFGSEVKAILASGTVGFGLDPASLAAAFTMWGAPEPATVFAGVRAVEPGGAVCFDGTLRRTESRYWSPCFDPRDDAGLEGASRELEERLTAAVRLRLRADVPVGAYVSGGIDSAVIAWMARAARTSPLQTFSLRFEDPRYDESEAQRAVTAVLGTEHHEVVVRPRDIADALPEVVWHAEAPLPRTGPAPMFLLSGLVRECGMKVVLTGEGADEMLGGYDVFKEAKVRRFWARQPASAARAALLARVHPYIAGNARGTGMWTEFFRRRLTETDDPFYSHRPRWDSTGWSLRFLGASVRASGGEDVAARALADRFDPAGAARTPLGLAQTVEMVTFLSPYLLSSQGDRMAMAHGVETRYPFLDPEVVGFCSRLVDGRKLRGLREKLVLRVLASRSLPRAVWERRKWPYRAPIASALFGSDAPEYVRRLLSPSELAEEGAIDAASASALVGRLVGAEGTRIGEREEMALTGLLTLQLLSRAFGRDLGGRVDRALEALAGGQPDVFVDRRAGGRNAADPAGSRRHP
jgi:asparagine synthase (glutamine-hydrolysing)